MERASQALAQMDYLTTETLCLKALRIAREAGDWSYYARVLLPLQEARRQRRMIAADGVVRLGTARLEGRATGVQSWLDAMDAGCIVVTHPHGPDEARILEDEARRRRWYIEVLLADNAPEAPAWTLRAFRVGGDVRCTVPAPPTSWQDTWLPPGEQPMAVENEEAGEANGAEPPILPGQTPADWFIDATEALGDAALRRVTAPEGDPLRIEQIEQMLQVVTDHEILHQRLGDAARALRSRVTK